MNSLFRFPSAVRHDPAVDAWFDRRTDELGDIAKRWFEVMRARGDDVREIIHDGFPTACVTDAAFAYVAVFRHHVNVGFFQGANLPDPKELLEGAGLRMRHVKITTGADVDQAALGALIEAAYWDMKRRSAT